MAVFEVKWPEAKTPVFEVMTADGSPTTVRLYTSHYDRMVAVIAAARSGNRMLLEWALKNYDEQRTKP